MIEDRHDITTIASTPTEVTRECSCGWVTVGTIPEPAHHTPLAVREAQHVEDMAKIADGSVWNEVPERHTYTLHLQRRLSDNTPNQVVVTAVWLGGSRQVALFPWTLAGLGEAAAWLNEHGPAVWTSDGRPVDTFELTRFAP